MRRLTQYSTQIVASGLLLLALLAGCAAPPRVDIATLNSSVEQGYRLAVNPMVVQRLGGRIKDEALSQYLAALGSRLQPGADAKAIIPCNEPAPAAFALPGGEVALSRGLIFLLESEDELVALVAHLLGHARARHGLQVAAVGRAIVEPQAEHTRAPDGYVASAASQWLLSEPFATEQEIEADRHAHMILAAAGYGSLPYGELLQQLQRRIATLPDKGTGGLVRHHPFSTPRIAALKTPSDPAAGSQTVSLAALQPAFAEVLQPLQSTREAYDLYRQAKLLERDGAIDQATRLYLQAATAAPEEAYILTGLGMAYMRQEVLVTARQHLNRATRIDNHYYYSQLGLGYIYLQEQDLTRAVRRLRRSQGLLPTAQGGYLLARVFDIGQNREAALVTYRDVIRYFADSKLAELARKRITELEATDGLE